MATDTQSPAVLTRQLQRSTLSHWERSQLLVELSNSLERTKQPTTLEALAARTKNSVNKVWELRAIGRTISPRLLRKANVTRDVIEQVPLTTLINLTRMPEARQVAELRRLADAFHAERVTPFDAIKTEAQAYWLGWMARKARLDPNRRHVRVTGPEQDAAHLRGLGRLLSSPVQIKDAIAPKTQEPWYWAEVAVSSAALWERLAALGFATGTNHLRTTKILDHIPPKLLHHFVRGLVDAQGGLTGQGAFAHFQISGPKKFLMRLRDLFVEHAGCSEVAITKKAGRESYALPWSGCFQLSAIEEWLYQDAELYLRRKHRRFAAATRPAPLTKKRLAQLAGS